ncbi:MAG: acyloxyacyl hydrolase [Bacteroidota bacterium]
MKTRYTSYVLMMGLLLGGFIAPLGAQQSQGWVLETALHYGQLLKHTPKLRFEVDQPSAAFELLFRRQTFGDRTWQAEQGYPMLGFSLMAYRMAPNDLLGNAYSLAPNLSTYLFRRKKWNAQFMFGYGLAYLDRTFDLDNNPQNNAIGSHLNVTVKLRFAANVRLSPHWGLHTGFSFTHYSNGASQLPNLGLNIPAMVLGLRYTPRPWTETRYTHLDGKRPPPKRRWGAHGSLGLGLRERGAAGGPRNPIYLATAAVTYANAKFNRFMLGAEFEFNRGVFLFGQHVGEFENRQEALRRSMRWMLFVGDELQYHNFSISMQVGFYLHPVYLGVFPLSTRFGVRYYLPPLRSSEGRFYLALQLKSHLIIAEYFSFSGGVRF